MDRIRAHAAGIHYRNQKAAIGVDRVGGGSRKKKLDCVGGRCFEVRVLSENVTAVDTYNLDGDSGATWSAINQGLDEIIAAHPTVNALLVDEDNSNTLYLATSGYGVFRSTNGGATWASFNNGLTHLDVSSLTLVHGSPRVSHRGRSSPLGSYTLYAGTPGGVFKLEQFGK